MKKMEIKIPYKKYFKLLLDTKTIGVEMKCTVFL